MSVLPSLVAQARQRTAPPPVPDFIDRSEFDSNEAYEAHMKDRRKAKERLREFNRPARVRQRPKTQPTAATLQLTTTIETMRTREMRILFGLDVETGRKKAPMLGWSLQPRPSAREHYEEMAQRLPTLTSAAALHSAVKQQEAHTGVSLSQVRRAVTVANQRADPKAVARDSHRRRSIKKGLSATRPAVYPAILERKRAARRVAQREARRVQQEERGAERVRINAKRDALKSEAEWAYEICREEWELARTYGSDDEQYLRQRRIDAGHARRDARAAAVAWVEDQKMCKRCGEWRPMWVPRGMLPCECAGS